MDTGVILNIEVSTIPQKICDEIISRINAHDSYTVIGRLVTRDLIPLATEAPTTCEEIAQTLHLPEHATVKLAYLHFYGPVHRRPHN